MHIQWHQELRVPGQAGLVSSYVEGLASGNLVCNMIKKNNRTQAISGLAYIWGAYVGEPLCCSWAIRKLLPCCVGLSS